ncbi:MAG: hypothetical protein JJU13_17260 [Balneolaceae bacterium]|nr:hypothetical protein [Balneolaceae bacterium]
MMELIETTYNWFLSLGDQYGVDPIIFGVIYVGAIPLFTISVAWLMKNYRQKKSIVMPVMSASICFVSAYLYLIIAGENVPWWVYGFLITMLLYGGWSTIKKVKKQVSKVPNEI